MPAICLSCGQPDDSGSAYCLNPACGALLAPAGSATTGEQSDIAGRAPSAAAAASKERARPLKTSPPHKATSDRAPQVAPPQAPSAEAQHDDAESTESRQEGAASSPDATSQDADTEPEPPGGRHRADDGQDGQDGRNPTGWIAGRWLPIALVLAMAFAIGIAALVSSPQRPSSPRHVGYSPAPVLPTAAPSSASPVPSARTSPSPTPSPSPSRKRAPATKPHTPKPATKHATPPARPVEHTPTPASPKPRVTPSMSVSDSGRCVDESGGWSIVLHVRIQNGSAVDALVTYGPDSNAGVHTVLLDARGSAFTLRVPESGPALVDQFVSWTLGVTLSTGDSVSQAGYSSRPFC